MRGGRKEEHTKTLNQRTPESEERRGILNSHKKVSMKNGNIK
jgi:hypothetical protein